MKNLLMAAMAAMACSAMAERVETRLADWTCDGKRVTVPHTWNAVDGADGTGAVFQDKDNSVAGRAYLRCAKTYRTALPEPTPAKRYFLRCDGAAITATVCVNGRIVGRHEGPVTGFTFELTDFLREHDNVLEIVVDNYFDWDIPPIYGDYTVCGGLYRPVTLVETDPVCIDPLRDGGPGVEIETEADGTVRVKTYVNGAEDAVVTYAVNGQTFADGTFRVKGVEPWSPESPKLYELAVIVRKGTWSDTVRQKIGFRTAEFRADGFYLNGVRRQLRGVNYHQEREGKGWAIDAADIAEDIALIRRMGADAMRGTHYPHSPACYDECDRQGVLTWIEFPASSLVRTNAAYCARLRTAVRETVAQHRNHPSTLVWSLGNELYSVWDGHEMPAGFAEPVIRDLQALVKTLDRYHPTTLAAAYADRTDLNAIADVYAFNAYPGWYGESSTNMTQRIDDHLAKNRRTTAGVGEYGGGASVHHHSNPLKKPTPGGRFHPEEMQTDLHCIEYGIIKADPRIWGSFIWMMFDAASDNRNEGDHKGVNDKGLVTRDHGTLKDAYYFYKANWNPEPMLHLCGKRMLRADSDRVTVRGFSNVGAVTLVVNGRTVGTLEPDAVRTVTWRDVPLEKGVNTIELRAGGRTDACSWLWPGVALDRRHEVSK